MIADHVAQDFSLKGVGIQQAIPKSERETWQSPVLLNT